ncbi:MAG: hypothetical protein KAR84_02170 [Elusimicrobiales bacterium]|nr:hypothetical protein [Elusimicrobiales bacterium]MCK5357143.1 hypothetical protein [Elusimicrobiales bacterium]
MNNIRSQFSDIHKDFFIKTSNIIEENIDKITFNDLKVMYWDFLAEASEKKGNAEGFTGYFEYLLLQAISHSIPGTVKKEAGTNIVFKFKIGEYELYPNQKLNDYTMSPDIVIRKNGSVIHIIEEKIYLTNGVATLQSVFDKFNKFDRLKSLKGVSLFIASLCAKNSKFPDMLAKYKVGNKKFNYVIMDASQISIKNWVCDNVLVK